MATPKTSCESVIVYAGRHYGRLHRVVRREGRMVTARHEPTGHEITVPVCDTEVVPE